MSTRYPIRAVSKITGISPETLRAWERRYQAVVPERVGRGRQYGPEDIDRLGRLNRLVLKGHAIGSIASLRNDELDALNAMPAHAQSAAHTLPAGPVELLSPVLAAIEAFDPVAAGDELGRLAAALAPREFVHVIVVPLMREVGARWHDGRFSVAQEHLVSELLRNLLGAMIRQFRPSAHRGRVVIAAPQGERHEFGILAAAMLASLSGIESIYVGADLPADQIGQAAHKVAADIVLLGITVASRQTLGEVQAVAAAMPPQARLWIGGSGVAALDLSKVAQQAVAFFDLSAFEVACRQWPSTGVDA